MPSPWIWDDRSKRYRDPSTGRFVSQRKAITLRNFYNEAVKGDIDKLTRRLVNKQVSIQQWTLEMRQVVKETYIDQYMLARGGRQNMTQSDWGRIGGMLKRQYEYVDRFARDIDAGKVSGGQIRTRARMYIDSSTQAFERAKAESHGIPRLPQYPGDGQTVCRSNCQCDLHYEEQDDHWDVYWRLGVAEHCPDCVRLADEWKPLRVPKQ